MSQLIRYVLVQILAYGLDMGGFLIALELFGDHPLPANASGKVLAGAFAFLAHRTFTFRLSEEGRDSQQALRYFLLLGLNLPLSTAVLSLVMRANFSETLSKILADGSVLLISYWLSKRFVFLTRSPRASSRAPG